MGQKKFIVYVSVTRIGGGGNRGAVLLYVHTIHTYVGYYNAQKKKNKLAIS